MSCFCMKCFNDGFIPELTCKEWHVANLHKLSNGFGVKHLILEVKEYVAAVYTQVCINEYVGKTNEVDESEAHVTFFQHSGKIEKNTVFRMSKKKTNSGYHSIKQFVPFQNLKKQNMEENSTRLLLKKLTTVSLFGRQKLRYIQKFMRLFQYFSFSTSFLHLFILKKYSF